MKKGDVFKKIAVLLITMAMLATIVSCGNDAGDDNEPEATAAPTEEPIDPEVAPEESEEQITVKDLTAEGISIGSSLNDRYVSQYLTDNGKAAVEAGRTNLADLFSQASITYEQMKDSQISYANSARVAEVIRKSINGESVTIGILGDSIPSGAGASSTETGLAPQILKFWNDSFHPVGKEGNAEMVNASIGSNSLLNICHRMDDDLLAHDPDIVIFTEWTAHDSVYDRAAFESILIKLLEKGCAVICLVVTADNGANNTAIFKKTAIYYNVPIVSWAQVFKKSKLSWEDYGSDSIHPNDKGHAGMAASACMYLLSVAENLPEISSADSEIPAEAYNKYGNLFVNATIYDRNDSDKFTIESKGAYVDADMQLSSFRTYNGWFAEGSGDPIVFTVSNTQSFMIMFGHRTTTGKCKVKIEDMDAGTVISEYEVDNTSTYDYSWNTGVTKDLEGKTIKVTVTPIGGTFVLGLMVTPV